MPTRELYTHVVYVRGIILIIIILMIHPLRTCNEVVELSRGQDLVT
jgi:hypothetical protein